MICLSGLRDLVVNYFCLRVLCDLLFLIPLLCAFASLREPAGSYKNKISRKAAKVRIFTEGNEGSNLGFAMVAKSLPWDDVSITAPSSTEASAAPEGTNPETTRRSFSRNPFVAFATFCKKLLPLREILF